MNAERVRVEDLDLAAHVDIQHARRIGGQDGEETIAFGADAQVAARRVLRFDGVGLVVGGLGLAGRFQGVELAFLHIEGRRRDQDAGGRVLARRRGADGRQGGVDRGIGRL